VLSGIVNTQVARDAGAFIESMRVPANPDPMKLKKDLERLLRGSEWWDRPQPGAAR